MEREPVTTPEIVDGQAAALRGNYEVVERRIETLNSELDMDYHLEQNVGRRDSKIGDMIRDNLKALVAAERSRDAFLWRAYQHKELHLQIYIKNAEIQDQG